MKHILQIAAIALLTTALISCNKEEETNTNTTPQDTTQTTTQKHNVELVYDANLNGLELSRIQDSLAKSDVDTVFMVPEGYNQYSTVSTVVLQYLVAQLRDRKNINPNKVWGKGELQLKASSVDGYPEIRSFFSDTLGYNVTLTYQK